MGLYRSGRLELEPATRSGAGASRTIGIHNLVDCLDHIFLVPRCHRREQGDREYALVRGLGKRTEPPLQIESVPVERMQMDREVRMLA